MIKIKDFMIKEVKTIDSNTTVFEATSQMVADAVSSLIVVEKQKPVGLITERSIVRKLVVNLLNPKKPRCLK